MGIVINNNVTALNAWRNLSASNSNLSKSLAKLSSGLQINKGSDNPAGLVISEKLRAQATGLEQATKNAGDAVSVIQVAEGALTEVHSILNSIRALAVHAANDGANDADSLNADQSQVDNAIDAITRIANTTKFLGKYLLNGGAGSVGTVQPATTNVSSSTISTALTSGYLSFNVTTGATQATFSTLGTQWTGSGSLAHADTLTINGVGIALAASDSRTTVVSKINARSADTGVNASTGTSQIIFYGNGYGSQYDIRLSYGDSGTLGGATILDAGIYTIGSNVVGLIGGSGATGNGLTLTSTGSNWSGTAITFTTTGNVTTASSTDLWVDKGQLKFNIGANAVADEFVSFSINDMRSTALGSAGNGYLDNTTSGIKTSQGNSLTNNAAGAVSIIDDAITDVSNERSKLGAYQKNAIESMQNNLGATLENIQAAESRIRDLDMAREMMSFTKHQILIQAGTAMLAQANMIPQSALQLIG